MDVELSRLAARYIAWRMSGRLFEASFLLAKMIHEYGHDATMVAVGIAFRAYDFSGKKA